MNPRIEPLGDRALLIEFGDCLDSALNLRAVTAATAVRAAALPGVSDVAAAYASVCVQYDPQVWTESRARTMPFANIAARIAELIGAATVPKHRASDTTGVIEIPVCYGGEFGPDLNHVAEHAGLSADEVVARHGRDEYRVAMLGFAPGFPYLLGLDEALHTPRRAEPRTRVPAGSVAIGGAQTGIYPRELPGGWHIIGRTPLQLFDVTRAAPALLLPGQCVRFRAISAAEFRSR